MGRQRGPNVRTGERRQSILRAARDSFVEHGVDGASLRDIAARAGMTHAGLLHHFRSKDDLVVALLQQRDAEESARDRAQRATTSDEDRLAPLIAELVTERQAAPELVRLWLEVTAAAARPAHPAHDYFVERYAQVRSAMTEYMRSRVAAGAVRGDIDPEHVGALLAAVLDGLQLQWLHDHDLPVVDILDHFLELVAAPATPPTATGDHGRGSTSSPPPTTPS
ncbi:TetR/AcrR family transcriptional regulator [Modestobacter marinus]|uniref:AcrR family transcriptional regulator n=1 Tax=Modestobacter marinus TaxID=477641 RepID=A0A846LTC2_9ACTN|nr:TetR/AcrR family transcriptional regulator [Modestobacter marinus]NIH66709.1 AcrR family transcriptional regulator [Modestobacter marinus]GGL48475.1 TetR family transcriptional regulator [Modestobacter marinus]